MSSNQPDSTSDTSALRFYFGFGGFGSATTSCRAGGESLRFWVVLPGRWHTAQRDVAALMTFRLALQQRERGANRSTCVISAESHLLKDSVKLVDC